MSDSRAVRFRRFVYVVAAASLTVLSLPALAHGNDDKVIDPGFRPHSRYASTFLNTLDTATIAVHPTVVRKADRTSHSSASQKQIIALIRKHEMAAAAAGSGRVDLGRLEATSQWDLFLNDMQRIAETLKGQVSGSERVFVSAELPSPVVCRCGADRQECIRSSARQISEESHGCRYDRFRGAS